MNTLVAELVRAGIGPVRQAYRKADEADRGDESEVVLICLRQGTKVIELGHGNY